jgi:hypothetical protein
MLGIKERAEGAAPAAPPLVYGEAALWLLAFVGYLIANVGVIFWRDWRPAVPVAVGAALVTIAIALTTPPVWVDALAVIGIWVAVRWGHRYSGVKASTGSQPV